MPNILVLVKISVSQYLRIFDLGQYINLYKLTSVKCDVQFIFKSAINAFIQYIQLFCYLHRRLHTFNVDIRKQYNVLLKQCNKFSRNCLTGPLPTVRFVLI